MHAGAYKVKKWEQDKPLSWKPNENYISVNPSWIPITFRTIENTDTLLAAAMAGNVDMTLTGLSFDQAKQLEKRSNHSSKSYFYSLPYLGTYRFES